MATPTRKSALAQESAATRSGGPVAAQFAVVFPIKFDMLKDGTEFRPKEVIFELLEPNKDGTVLLKIDSKQLQGETIGWALCSERTRRTIEEALAEGKVKARISKMVGSILEKEKNEKTWMIEISWWLVGDGGEERGGDEKDVKEGGGNKKDTKKRGGKRHITKKRAKKGRQDW